MYARAEMHVRARAPARVYVCMCVRSVRASLPVCVRRCTHARTGVAAADAAAAAAVPDGLYFAPHGLAGCLAVAWGVGWPLACVCVGGRACVRACVRVYACVCMRA